MVKKLSRRDFLKLTGVTSASLALSACGVKASEFPTAISISPTGISLPTETLTSTPTLTPTPTLPLEQLPQTKEALTDFIRAFQATGADVSADQLLRKGLEIRSMTDKDEKQYEVALAHIENPVRLGGDYPLMIKMNGEWKEATFRNMADKRGIKIGTNYGTPYFDSTTVQKLKELVAKHYNFAIIDTIAMQQTEQKQGIFNFSKADEAVKEAIANDMYTEGDDLLFGASNQKWTYMKDLKDKGASKEELKQAMINHIEKVVSHFKGQMKQWSIVCEMGRSNGDDVYMDIIGEEYVDIAFQKVKDVDPTARRVLTETRAETRSGKNYAKTKTRIGRLKEKGLIDAVAIELHIDVSRIPSKQELIETFQSYGIEVITSSVDIDMSKVSGTNSERLIKQAEIAIIIYEAMVESGVSTTLTFWEGFGDQYNWLVRNLKITKPMATPFDDNLNPKAVYYALLQKMFEGSKLSS